MNLPTSKIKTSTRRGSLYAYPREKSINHFKEQIRRLTRRHAPDRQGDRSAINGARPGKAEKAGLGNRPQITAGRSTPDHYPEPRRDLLAALYQRADDDGQQHLQRLALRRCVARQMIWTS